MTDPTTTPSGSEYRVVTVADLRHELQREHLIINAHLQTISNQVVALDLRFPRNCYAKFGRSQRQY
jgi:hypothetical protein